MTDIERIAREAGQKKGAYKCPTCASTFLTYHSRPNKFCSRACSFASYKLPRHEVTPQTLAALFSYCPTTGLLHWKVARRRIKAGDQAGSPKSGGYLQVRVSGKLLLVHRVAWCLSTGQLPTSPIDHINGDGSDNRLLNLRICTHTQNMWNAKPRQNRSGYKGVTQHCGKWQARLRVNNRMIHLGTFDDPLKAAEVYTEAAKQHAGEFAYANRGAAIRAKFCK